MPELLIAAASTGVSEGSEVLVDVVLVLAGCLVAGILLMRARQSVLVGYMLAGLVLGPGALGVVRDVDGFSFLGEVGVALLLFTIALDLPLDHVRSLGRRALVAGVLQLASVGVVGAAVAMLAGLETDAAIIVGLALGVSSTAVVVRVLADRAAVESSYGILATGMLLVQDLAVVAILLVPQLLAGDGGPGDAVYGFGEAVVKLIALTAGMWAIERVVLRPLFRNTSGDTARELLVLSALTLSLGAVGAAMLLDLSPVLGGFLAGLVMAGAGYAPQVRSEVAPLRMGLVALFFAYVGLLADVGWMLDNALVIGLVTLGVIGGKALLTWGALRIARVPWRTALLASVALAQLGEFTFAILAAGRGTGVVDDATFQLLVSTSLVTILLTPPLISATERLLHRGALAAGDSHAGPRDRRRRSTRPPRHVVVVGLGPVGRAAVEAVAGRGIPVVGIDLNARTLEEDDVAQGGLLRVVFGDASRPEILASADIAHARLVAVTLPEPGIARTIIAQVRQLAPGVPIIARGRHNRFLDQLAAAGAERVVDEETVTGRELARAALLLLDR